LDGIYSSQAVVWAFKSVIVWIVCCVKVYYEMSLVVVAGKYVDVIDHVCKTPAHPEKQRPAFYFWARVFALLWIVSRSSVFTKSSDDC
jgi:hypothetical protein